MLTDNATMKSWNRRRAWSPLKAKFHKFLKSIFISINFNPTHAQYSSKHSSHYNSFICNHLNPPSCINFVYIFNNYIINICYTLFIYHYTCYKLNIYLSTNGEFTDIDYNENINFPQNDSNFETFYLPKCLHKFFTYF